PRFIPSLVEPIMSGTKDFVIGSRTRGKCEPGSMNAQQIFAGYLAGLLIRMLYRVRYTDMCPFRAIRRDSLAQLGMREETYGWNLEMQMKEIGRASCRERVYTSGVAERRKNKRETEYSRHCV